MDKKTSEIIFTRSGKSPVDSSNEKGEILTEVLIPEDTKGKKRQTAKRQRKSGEPRSKFQDYCANFPIDYFQIPRPLRTKLYNSDDLSDTNCALMALSLLGVPHDSDLGAELEPVGWLKGPHLILDRLEKDWSVAFDGEQLKEVLKQDPWLVVTDSVIQLAIGILRVKSEQGMPSESKLAKRILSKAGLGFVITENAKLKKPENITGRFFSNHPCRLITSVRLYEYVISKFWKTYRGRFTTEEKLNFVSEAYRLIFNEVMPKEMFADLTKSTRLNSCANAAMALIEYETSSKYEAIRGIFYENVNKVSDSEIIRDLDLITDNKGPKVRMIEELKSKYKGA